MTNNEVLQSLMLKSLAHSLCPPIIWNLIRRLANKPDPISYQGVTTQHNMALMHSGKFGEIRDKYAKLNPAYEQNVTRLRHYYLCVFATIAKDCQGDFLTAGISYGIAPREIYDFVDFGKLDKSYHLIDPFAGVDENGDISADYNRDPDLVRNQYPKDARIIMHLGYIPDCLDDSIGKLAFVHLNTGNAIAEAESLRYLYDRLSHGGIMVIDSYSYGKGNMDVYDPVINDLGVEVFSMVTGQGVIVKS
jgi:hypothetical protein